MKILQVCPYDWNAHGGVQAHVGQLSRHLAARGHKVLILAPGSHDPGGLRLSLAGRPVRVAFNGSRVPLCCAPRSVSVVRRAVRDFAADIVHVHEPLCPSTSLLASLFARVPLIATFHANHGRNLFSLLYSAQAALLRPVWARITLGIAVSRAAAACIGSRVTTPLRIVPNGIDTTLFTALGTRATGQRRTLLFVGRLEPRKGFAIALQAFSEIAHRIPDLDFAVVGDGEQRSLVRRLPAFVRARVFLRGDCSDEQRRRSYAAADLFIAPSTGRESFGLVLLEAMAAGVPLVASDIDGYREVMRHGIEGLLVPPSDPGALAAAIVRVLGDRELAGRFGAAGPLRARRYSWKRVGGQIERVYDEVLGGSPRRIPLAAHPLSARRRGESPSGDGAIVAPAALYKGEAT